jgi:hypothetical protein
VTSQNANGAKPHELCFHWRWGTFLLLFSLAPHEALRVHALGEGRHRLEHVVEGGDPVDLERVLALELAQDLCVWRPKLCVCVCERRPGRTLKSGDESFVTLFDQNSDDARAWSTNGAGSDSATLTHKKRSERNNRGVDMEINKKHMTQTRTS